LRIAGGLFVKDKKMPVLFIGHGSPMNAIAKNDFTETLANLARKIPTPKAILCVSAHWMSEGTWITHMKNPKTIHDFYGFPQALFDVQYPAPGSPEIADEIRQSIQGQKIHADDEMWGIDHGTWSVLRHMYPAAQIPLMQLSVYMEQPGSYHYNLGQELHRLRSQGILILGSGNIVHNLRKINWETYSTPHDWAIEFDEWAKKKIEQREFAALVEDALSTPAGKLSIPTPDHYYPLLYTLGASDKQDEIKFEYEGIHNASISMRCISFGIQN
jgi:4,5-DOPA dioxygenase extradiol